MVINPCLNCTKREVGCHGKCTDYADWKVKRKSPKSRPTYMQDEAINAYITERVNKRTKR